MSKEWNNTIYYIYFRFQKMNQVSHLKALCLKILVDLVWGSLEERTRDNKHSLEIDWNMEFLPIGSPRMESPLFSTAFIADSKIGLTRHTNFHANKLKLDLLLDFFNNIPDSLKLDIAHVMKKQYKSANIFHKVFFIEMGSDFFQIHGYLQSPSYTFTLIDMLCESGKKRIRKILSKECKFTEDYPYWKINSIVQIEKCITTFKNLRDFTDLSKSTADSTLKLLSKNCPFLKILNIPNSLVSDLGLAHLHAEDSVTTNLFELNINGTIVTPEGLYSTLTQLSELRRLECAIEQIAFSPIGKKKLNFSNMKWLRCFVSDSAIEQYLSINFYMLSKLFPNLELVVFYYTREIGLINVHFLRYMEHLTDINLGCLEHANTNLFTCIQHVSFEMPNVMKLSLDNFCNICLVSLFKHWPNLEYLHMKNLFCSACCHSRSCNDDFAHNLHHVVVENSLIPKHYLKLLATVETLALKSKNFINDFNEENSMHFGNHPIPLNRLSLISVDCNETSFDNAFAFGKWLLLHCSQLILLNLVNQEPRTDAINWFMRQQPKARITFQKILYKHKWFDDDVFTPCALCEAYKSF
uniref:Uncharacterized protein n=1 Tax=Strigamia maritima TaxID=126957 RepID=T1J468_STRMM